MAPRRRTKLDGRQRWCQHRVDGVAPGRRPAVPAANLPRGGMTEWGKPAHNRELPQMAIPVSARACIHSKEEDQELSTAPSGNVEAAEIAAEQTYVTGLHHRLDEIRARTVTRLDEA